MKQILGLFQTSDKNVNCTAAEPADPAAAEWPSHLKELHRVATRALKDLRRTNLRRLSDRERAEHDDLLKLMTAMSDRKKTAAVYFAMAEATSTRRVAATIRSGPRRGGRTVSRVRPRAFDR